MAMTFKQATVQASDQLATLYVDTKIDIRKSYWFLGNALHAYLRSLLATKAIDGHDGRARLLEHAFDLYTGVKPAPDIWVDDYGWWGCAFATALRNRNALGYEDPSFNDLFAELRTETGNCWERIKNNWQGERQYSRDWDSARNDADIVGGVANFSGDDRLRLSGRNTVTNAGFWLLTLELERLSPGDRQYALVSGAMEQWFQFWFAQGVGPGIGLLDSHGLILERPTGNSEVEDWYWSGDQGVLMIDLLRHLEKGSPPPYTESRSAEIAAAVVATMTDGDLPPGVPILQENLAFLASFPEFGVDYSTGKGILMRHLGDVCGILGSAWTDEVCGPLIRDSASAVWNTRVTRPDGQFSFRFNWGPPSLDRPLTGHDDIQPLVFTASGLDAMSVAASLWPDHEIE
jgi:hypothetical protein